MYGTWLCLVGVSFIIHLVQSTDLRKKAVLVGASLDEGHALKTLQKKYLIDKFGGPSDLSKGTSFIEGPTLHDRLNQILKDVKRRKFRLRPKKIDYKPRSDEVDENGYVIKNLIEGSGEDITTESPVIDTQEVDVELTVPEEMAVKVIEKMVPQLVDESMPIAKKTTMIMHEVESMVPMDQVERINLFDVLGVLIPQMPYIVANVVAEQAALDQLNNSTDSELWLDNEAFIGVDTTAVTEARQLVSTTVELNLPVGQNVENSTIFAETTLQPTESTDDTFTTIGATLSTVSSLPVPKPTCSVGQWGEWSICSAPCDGGLQTRQRSIAGRDCPLHFETTACNIYPCAGCWVAPWSQWGICTSRCGDGVRRRHRIAHGVQCPHNFESKDCQGDHCQGAV